MICTYDETKLHKPSLQVQQYQALSLKNTPSAFFTNEVKRGRWILWLDHFNIKSQHLNSIIDII